MTKKEIQLHLETYQDIDIEAMRATNMFTEVQLKNMKFCNVWGKISPVFEFLINNIIVNIFAKWVVIALKATTIVLDKECDISK